MFVLWFLVNFHHLLRSLIKHLKFVHYSSLRDLFGNSITTHVQNKNNFQCLAIHEGFAANFFTFRQLSCKKVMFSLACVCLQGGGEYAWSKVPSRG